MKLPKKSLVPTMALAAKGEPSTIEERPAEALPTHKVSEQVTEVALELINEALAPIHEKAALLKNRNKTSKLTVAATYEAFAVFEKAVGGREALLNVLKYLPPTAVGTALVHKLVEDPDFIQLSRERGKDEAVEYSLGVLCRRHKLPLNTLVAAFRDSKTAEIAVAALTQLAPHTPAVVNQIAEDATNRYTPCPVCEGEARVPRIGDDGEFIHSEGPDSPVVTQLCYECRGTGKIWQEHNVVNRKLFLQMVKLIDSDRPTPTPVQVQLQQANVFGGQFLPGDGSFERMVHDVNINVAPTKQSPLQAEDDIIVYEVEESTAQK